MVRLDDADRDFLFRVGIWIGGGGVLAVSVAGILGLAWRVFQVAAG